MPTRLEKLDFPEKLIQSGKKENTEAVLKRIKVSAIGGGKESQLMDRHYIRN